MSFHRPFCFHPVRTRRARRWLVTGALAFALASRLSAIDPIKTYASLALKDGRTLSSVQVINYTATDVLVRHVGGATSLSSGILPESVLADLHLPAPVTAAAMDPAFLALANKVAVSDSPADPAPGSGLPKVEAAQAAPGASNVSARQLQAAAIATVAATAPAGEGNFIESAPLAPAIPVTAAQRSTWVTMPGRVAVAPTPGDTRLLRDVEIRAYPAELLTRYVDQARATVASQAQLLREQAVALIQQGRTADGDALAVRAGRLTDNYLDLLPVAPFTARSDEFGHFTLRHDLRDARLVAVGRIATVQGEYSYAWVGLTPEQEAVLTEANATAVTAPATTGASYAAR